MSVIQWFISTLILQNVIHTKRQNTKKAVCVYEISRKFAQSLNVIKLNYDSL